MTLLLDDALKNGQDSFIDSDTAGFYSAALSLDSNHFNPALYKQKWDDLDKQIFDQLQSISGLKDDYFL